MKENKGDTLKCMGAYYLGLGKEFGFLDGFKKMCTWILIFTNLVPISLLVSLELVKFWQAMFMSYDKSMYDDE